VAAVPLSPGTRLGPYEILAPLGAGGMGEVYRARDTRLGRDVAVKVLPQHLTEHAENRARFEREAKTVSSLNHPHICTLFDVGRDADTDYLVMELIEGETLAHRLARGPLPFDQVIAVGAQIADAISRAHRAGIVHRDLKPGNIMLTKSGAKLMDFGLARATGLPGGGSGGSMGSLTQSPTVAEPLTAQGSILGTYQYMAPEQLEGKETDARGDIWALGCVLYEMATGKHAFEGRSQASLIAAILEHAPAPIADIQPMSPLGFDRLVRGCLAKDPDDRVQSAHDVGLQLEWIGADPAASTPVAPAAVGRSRGTRVRLGLASLGVIGVVAVLAFMAGSRRAAPAETTSSVFEQRTFRRQSLFNARFMPDGKTIVLSAALDGNHTELFVLRPDYPEPQPLGKKDMHLLAVSPRGELLVLNHARYSGYHRLFFGTLARMPLEGAAPRELMEDVRDADWAPDGETMAVIHDVGGTDRLEYPVGHVLHTSAGYLSDVRVSPDGNLVAFMEHPSRFDDRGSVKVVDRSGKVRELSGGYWGEEGMAWAADGKALYFSGGAGGAMYAVYRTTLDGGARVISDNAGVMTILDVAKDGTWAVTRDDTPLHLLFRAAGGETDVDLSWLDNSLGPVLSGDAKTLLFTDQSEFAGPNYGVAMRPTSGGPIVRLGEGTVEEISKDEKSVLAMVPSTPPRVVSYPMGVGKTVQLDRGQFENVSDARWLPGETRILVSGNQPQGPARAFLLDPATHDAKPVGPDGIWNCFPSPDGKTFLARTKTGWAVFPLVGTGAGTPIPSLTPRDYFIRWNIDGSAVFVSQRGEVPAPVERVELATGKRQTVTTLSEGESAARVSVIGVSIADDLRTVAYTAFDYSSVLFTATRAGGSRP
jgi:eukaryotic-like serine/threonine-protein kinase